MTTMTEPRLSKKQEKAQKVRGAIEQLQTMLQPGDTLKTVLKQVSRSGMYRHIAVIWKDENISYLVAKALEDKLHDDGSIGVSGCGMDMGFDIVYQLGSVLWPNGTPTPHGTRNGEPDSDGGYALKQAWL